MDGNLYFAEVASPGTIRNLKRNPAGAIDAVDVLYRRGYRFTGRASILLQNGAEATMNAEWVRATNGPEYPVEHVNVATFSITALPSPAHVFTDGRKPRTKSRAATIRSTA